MPAASGPSLSSGGEVSAVAVGAHQTPARRSLPCSVSSSAVSSIDPSSRSIGSKLKRACPPRGFDRPLVVGDEAAALHQVHDERDRLEPQQQVLASTPDVQERSTERLRRCGHRRLQRGEVERRESRERASGELLGQALGVSLDLGHLRHGELAVTRTSCARGRWRRRHRALRTPAASRATSAGRRRDESDRR